MDTGPNFFELELCIGVDPGNLGQSDSEEVYG